MTALWTSVDVAVATGGKTSGEWDADGISINSRTVSVGDLFIALQGPRFDGHDFFNEALDRGASAAMVSNVADISKENVSEDRLVFVDDTLDGLNALARAARERAPARIAAITGSVGKTTTKEALAFVLNRQCTTHATDGNLNNHWGVPVSLARMPSDTAFGVFELGMNHAGEIEPLSKLVRTHVALITAIEAVHLEHFSSVADIALAKAEIFKGMEPDGIAILPVDNPYYEILSDAAGHAGVKTIVGFGTDRGAAYRLIAWTVTETGTRVAADINGRRIVFEIGLRGKHMALNSLAVLAAVSAMDGDIERAAGDLYDMSAPKGRGQRSVIELDAGSFVLIDESYNASPVSMAAMIYSLAATQRSGRIVLALGDMLELGPDAPSLHTDLAVPITSAGVDAVWAAGPLMAHLSDALPSSIETHHAGTSKDLADQLAASVRPNDIVAVKGSFGSKMSVVVDALQDLGNQSSKTSKSVVNGD